MANDENTNTPPKNDLSRREMLSGATTVAAGLAASTLAPAAAAAAEPYAGVARNPYGGRGGGGITLAAVLQANARHHGQPRQLLPAERNARSGRDAHFVCRQLPL